MTERPLLDQTMLDSLKDLLGDKFGQLITAFLSDSEARFASLKTALPEPDLTVIKNEAHGVKGSARNIGANPLAEICADIEDQARAGNADGLEQKIAAAERSFAAVSEELRALVD